MPDAPEPAERAEKLQRLNQAFADFVPHNKALGMRFVDWGKGVAVLSLPYDPRFVGNPETGVMHGGVITALLDATSGASVFLATRKPHPIATLDLRIDYLKPATPGKAVTARATCYKLTRNVAFTRAVAFHDDPEDPIATSAGTFMLTTKGPAAFDMKDKEGGS